MTKTLGNCSTLTLSVLRRLPLHLGKTNAMWVLPLDLSIFLLLLKYLSPVRHKEQNQRRHILLPWSTWSWDNTDLAQAVMQIPGTLLSEFLQTVHYQLQSNVEYTPNILEFCVLADFRFFDSESRSKMNCGFHRQSQNHTPYQYRKEASTPLLSSSQWAHPHPADTFSVPAITDGYARTTWPKHFHPETYVGLPVHWAVSLLREGTTGQWQSRQRPRSQVKLVPHPRSSRSSPRPWMHHHTQPTVLSRVSCRPLHLYIDRFHQPCLLPGRIPG